MNTWKPLRIVASISLVLVLGFVAIEGMAMVLHYQKHGAWRTSCLTSDPVLGWDVTPGCRLAPRTLRDSAGNGYVRSYQANDFGSRFWGDPKSTRSKLMIVGDSFTEAREVSNNKTYYALLAEETPFEVFAYGVRGYGTLQELIKTKQLLEIVQPDVYILQFCANDFVNNSMASEAFTIFENQKIRPYRVDGSTVYAYDRHDLYPALLHASVAFRLMDIVVQALRAKWHQGDTPAEAMPKVEALHGEAFDTTVALLNELAETLPEGTDRYAFNCTSGGGSKRNIRINQDFKSAATAAGFEIIDGVRAHAEQYGRDHKVSIYAGGTHMNELGNLLWARFLADFLNGRYPASS